MTNTVTFLFPRTGEIPIGGFKVVYEYGNRLIDSGINVNYVYGIASRKDLSGTIKWVYYTVRIFRYLKYRYFMEYKPNKWFNTKKGANHLLRYSLNEKYIPQSDVIIATSWTTAYWLNEYNLINSKRKFYFIQHFEDWHGTKEKVIHTWKMNLKKIVIAPWLKDIGDNLGVECFTIENGFNTNEFYLTTPIEDRDRNLAIMLWHNNPFKGCKIGLEAINIVKKEIKDFKVILFGVPKRPKDLPSWIQYYQMPKLETHRHLYNNSAIFIGTSYSEGWGLTVGEAMLCGCSVACTNNSGYTILAKNNKTALLSDVGNPKKLAENIIRLVKDDKLRIKLAKNANEEANKYTWDKSYEKFYNLISRF